MSEPVKADLSDVKVHVCHKCGLPRKIVPEGAVDLGWCGCHGQTWFLYEDKSRTVKEAIEIGKESYLRTVALYLAQERENAHAFMNLAKEYERVLRKLY